MQAQHFGDLHRHFANRIVRAVSSGDNMQIAWQAWDIVRMSFCVEEAVFGADPLCVNAILRGRRRIWDTLHSTLYTSQKHFTHHSLHLATHHLYH